MSEVKLKLVSGHEYVHGFQTGSCDGCYHFGRKPETCPNSLYDDESCYGGSIWVIDDSEIETDKPKSPWVKIEDAELVDGEWYWCLFDDGSKSCHHFSWRGFLVGARFWDTDDVTHVIHLPKPQPPEVD